jgi:hypothetical protein
VYAPRPAEQIELAAVRRMEATRESISYTWQPADVPGWSWVEFVVTPDTLRWDVDEVGKGFRELLEE